MDDKQTLTKEAALDLLMNYIPAGLAFLMPVFFLPITSEFYEFNKMTLLTVVTILMLLIWSVKMLVTKRVYVTKSKMDLALLLFVGVFVLSTIFSIDQTSSIYGKYGRWFPSLTGMLTLYVMYYVVSSNANKAETIKTALLGFIAGGTVSTIVALLRYFGITLGDTAYLQAPNFTLTGSSTTAAVIGALAATLSLVMLTFAKKQPVKIFLIQSTVLNFLLVALFNVTAGWAVFAAGIIGYLFFVPIKRVKENKTQLTALLGVVAAVVLALLLPNSRALLENPDYPREINLPQREAWVVTVSTIRDFPLLGTGPSTFYLNFPRYRPLTLNNTDSWNVRFDKAPSEIFTIMASLGIIGSVAALYLGVRVFRFVMATRSLEDKDGISTALHVGLLSLLVMMFFTYATVLSSFLFFLFLAYSVAKPVIDRKPDHAESIILSLASFSSMSIIGSLQSEGKETFQYIVAVPIVAIAIAGGYFTYQNYAAEYYTRQAISAAQRNDGQGTFNNQTQAINTNPQRYSYHNAYTQTNLALANTLAQNPNLSDQDRQVVQALIAQSIRSARISTEVVNPLNVGSWEVRGQVYRALIGVANNADTWAINAYNTAIQLDPTNPRLRVDLGGIYYARGDYLSAANLFREATRLKSDYANGHYNFAAALTQLQAYNDARRELQIVQRLVDQDSPDYARATQELAALEAVAGAQDQRPSIEDLEAQATPAEEAEPTPQEPIAGPEEAVETNLDQATITPPAGDEGEEQTPEEGN